MALQAETMKHVTAGNDGNSVTNIATSKLAPQRLLSAAPRCAAGLPYSFIISFQRRSAVSRSRTGPGGIYLRYAAILMDEPLARSHLHHCVPAYSTEKHIALCKKIFN